MTMDIKLRLQQALERYRTDALVPPATVELCRDALERLETYEQAFADSKRVPEALERIADKLDEVVTILGHIYREGTG